MRASSTRRRSPPLSTPIGSSNRSPGKPETGGHRPSLALGAVAAGGRELVVGPAVPSDVALAGVFFHRDAQLLESNQLLVDASTRQHVRDGGSPIEHSGDTRILRQVAEPALAQDLAARRFERSAEDSKERGLAGAVATDQTDLVAGHHGERGAVDDLATTNFHRERLDLQHGRPSWRGNGESTTPSVVR